MQTLLFAAIPWLLVVIAAAIFSLFQGAPDAAAYWEIFKRFLAAMLIAGIVLQVADGFVKGLREGLEKPK